MSSDPVVDAGDAHAPGANDGETRPSANGSPEWLTGRLVITWYVAGALLLTIPLWRNLRSAAIAGNSRDIVHYTWWLGWTSDALSSFRNPLVTHAMNWPDGVSAMNNTSLLLPGMLLLPLTVWLGSLATLNVLTVLAPALSASAMYACMCRIGTGVPAAAVAGVAFGFSPAVVNSLVGHVTMALAPLLPVLVLLGLRAWNAVHPVRAGLSLGLAAVVQLFTAEEILFQAVIGCLIVLPFRWTTTRGVQREALRRFTAAMASASAVVVLVAGFPLHQQFFGPYRQRGNPFDTSYYATDLLGFVLPEESALIRSRSTYRLARALPGGIEEHLAYVGLPLLILCVVTYWAHRADVRVRAAGWGLLVSSILTLGVELRVARHETGVLLPFAALRHIPVVEHGLATRFGFLVAMFAAVILGLAVDHFRARSPKAQTVVAALVVASLLTLLPRPLPVSRVDPAPEFFAGGSYAGAGQMPVLLVLPYPVETDPVAMRWQAASGYDFTMPGGYFLGPDQSGRAQVGGEPLTALARLLVEVDQTGHVPELSPAMRDQALRQLFNWHVDVVVVGPSGHRTELERTMAAILGRPPVLRAGVSIWEVAGTG